jgi:serine/threonine protein kinase
MSTYISEPGTRLGGRYRLEDRVSAGGGWSAWKAIDETLARPVTVLTFVPGFPRITDVVTAARAASRLTDARLAQVFDVEEDWDHAYIVMEWVGGDSLADLLAEGPLDAGQGAEIIEQCAEALAVAHAAGVAHLCLTPESLRWTHGRGVKVTGIGIDAALAGTAAEDPALTDTFGLGRLLYAALTGHWAGDDWAGLPPAPEVDGHPRSPRQVRAGVPAALDDVTCQALLQRAPDGGEAVRTPAMFAAALARAAPAQALGPPVTGQTEGFALGSPPAGQPDSAPWEQYADPAWRETRPRGLAGGRRAGPAASRSRALAAVVVVVVLAGAGLGALMLRHHSGGAPGGNNQAGHTPSASGNPVSVLEPVKADGFDPLSSAADDPHNENDAQAHFAVDGDPSTAWHSQYYFTARFGNLKSGTGLILDMGKPVSLSSVTVTLGAIPGANVRIELGDDSTRSPGTLHGFKTVASQKNAGGEVTFPVTSKVTGRYLLIWFTKLPPQDPGGGGSFEAKVYNVVVKGAG